MRTFHFRFSGFLLALFLLGGSAFAERASHKSAGDSFLLRSKPALAVREYEEELKTNPDSTATLFNLAIAHYSLGRTSEAIAALERLAVLDKTDFEARYNLGCLWLYEGNLEKAETFFREAKKYCPPTSVLLSKVDDGLELINVQEANASAQDLLSFASQHAAGH